MTEDNFKKLNITTLRSKSKEDLVCIIWDQYRTIDSIIEALGYIEEDIEKIKRGDANFVHDNP